jgi:hypothetical protein
VVPKIDDGLRRVKSTVVADERPTLPIFMPEHGVEVAGIVRWLQGRQLGPLHEPCRVMRDGPVALGEPAGEPAGVPFRERNLLGQRRLQDESTLRKIDTSNCLPV